MRNYVILLGAGVGERVGSDLPKQFLKISGKTVLEHSIEIFEHHGSIDEIILVVGRNFTDLCKEILGRNNYGKISKILSGGTTRQESSSIGTSAIEDDEANVLIHDAVRPLLPSGIIDDCIAALDKHDAVDVAIPLSDTLIKVGDGMAIEDMPARKIFMRGQTPQAFKLSVIKRAHALAHKCPHLQFTDDCGLVKAFNLAKIHVVKGDETNLKITYPIDVFIADRLFQVKHLAQSPSNLENLRGKVLVIFGSSGGIGRCIVSIAKKYGATVYGFSRSDGVDVTVKSDVRKALNSVCQEKKRIDFIVNAAGILRVGKILDRSLDDIRGEVETNYFGCINIAMESHKYLKQSRGMLLFFTSSSHTRGRASYAIYSSTKAAIANLVQALSEEWAEDGVKINAVNPERTATPMRTANFGREHPETLLSPDFVAEKTLASLLRDYTGQIIDIKGEHPQG